MLKKILFGGESGDSLTSNIALTLLRVFAGLAMAFAHGLGKVPPSEKFAAAVGNIGFPLPNLFAWAAGLSEFLGGIFIALGLFTRLSSAFLAFTMLIAVFVVHLNDPFGKKELGLLYLFVAILFLIRGANDWSLDSFFREKV